MPLHACTQHMLGLFIESSQKMQHGATDENMRFIKGHSGDRVVARVASTTEVLGTTVKQYLSR